MTVPKHLRKPVESGEIIAGTRRVLAENGRDYVWSSAAAGVCLRARVQEALVSVSRGRTVIVNALMADPQGIYARYHRIQASKGGLGLVQTETAVEPQASRGRVA